MTTGQRIAQRRKELGLSQESLGEQLGVSRQAIYKWESDSALPEIEKLITLSRLFGVSVGWLLGVEEETSSEEEPEELTTAQMKMVSEIADRYIQAMPRPKSARKWPWILAACLLLGVFIHLSGRIDELTNQNHWLQNAVSGINSSVSSQINGIAGRVEEILKAQNSLTAEYSTRILSTDYASGTVTIHMEAVPKTYAQGMSAVFVVDCGNGPREFAAEFVNNSTYVCDAQVELTDSISVYAVFVSFDGTRQTQLLETYSYRLSDSYAQLTIGDHSLMWKKFTEGKLVFRDMYVDVRERDPSVGDAKIEVCRLGLFLNQELVAWAEPCDQPASYIGNYKDTQFYKLPDLILEYLETGDIITVAALVTDFYGRQYMLFEVPYEVTFDPQTGIGELSWVKIVNYDRDPDQWILE